ncbi:hypothetical protein Tco_0890007 [Tanacetum coccineum]
MAFVSSPSSNNEVNTANEVSTANSSVSTDSTLDSTANLSDAIRRNGITRKKQEVLQRTGKRSLLIDTAGYDKPRNHDNGNRNQDNSRRTVNVEETSSKAMVAIDRAGFNWSFMADKEVTTNMALMAFSDLWYTIFNLATYKRGLASVEEQLVFYKKNEVMFSDQIAVLKRDASFKDSEIIALKSEIEKLKKEKECNQIKIDKFENASKCLDKLIGSQISDNSRKGVGYNVVPPPPTGLFAPPTIDLSNSGLEEFQQPEFKGYGPKASKSVCVDTSNEVKKTPDTPLVEELVSEKEKQIVFPTKIKFVKQQDKTARKPVNQKVNTAKAKAVNIAWPKVVNTARPKAVNTARPNSAVVNAVRDNQANVVKASTCWVWRPTKLDSASITLKKHNYIDARGISKISTVGDEAVHKELGDRMERAATTASSLEAEQDSDAQTRFEDASKQSNDPPLSRVNTLGSREDSMKIIELMAHCTTLSELENPIIYVSLIHQFWETASASTPENGEMEIIATIDGKVKIVNEASIRRHLKLEDANGISSLPPSMEILNTYYSSLLKS